MFTILVLSILICTFKTCFCEIGCRDEDNNLVDWYYLYKLPEAAADHPSKNATSGLHYAFITSQSSTGWQISEKNINQSESIPGRTLEPLFLGESNELLKILYNDEPPKGETDGTRGHTKGVVATDGTTGFWLIHSVPKYPPMLNESYHYPDTGKHYGQSFLCFSVGVDQMETIGQQLIMNEPHVYSYHIPSEWETRFPKLTQATEMKPITTSPYWNAVNLKSIGGVVFHSFAKSRQFNKELYADFIAPSLQADLLVETWQHGAGNLPSDCQTSQWKVMNVKSVEVTDNLRFTTMKDHSKWAVSVPGDRDFICVGDINRQEHQKVRGGGSVCSQIESIVQTYRVMVQDVESCPKNAD
ncbi:plancitoxin-1 [Armigeres subalbatus]|uniref:plancitoxin-1 n=1 Tax=Armigeres subalbatus TaxID=124917 RepID=UPI002ED4DE42